ncbi:Glutamyl aminopeptidase, partial [Stegodyphus mimosarum]
MEWWDDLWLNEGFASYVEYKGVNEQHPEWDVLSQFVTEDVQPVMDLDSTMSSHPIVQPVTHPDEITEIFDDISYGKGASVLRMLEFFVGKDNFRRGISRFLKKYQFRNAQTADLWQELSNECGYQGNHTIASIMKTWTEQMGFPYIDIRRSAENSSVFVAKQNRFVKNEALYRKKMNSSKEYTWSIPLSYVTENGQTDIVWIFDEKEAEFTVPVIHNEWVKFNVNQTGYYLVNYEENDWNKLTELLMSSHESLSPSDRSNLLFDTFLLAEAGHIQFDVFLSMTKYLKNETHLIPWETAYASFVYLCQLLEFTDVNFLLKSYVKDLTDSLYKTLGWKTTENHLDNLLRTTIIGLACHSGNQNCLADASQLFQNWTQGQEIPSNLRSLVYHYGMAEIGREEHWNYMWNKFLIEESPPERKTLLYGLAHVRVPYLIHRYLEYAMDDTKIRRQDFFAVLSYIAGNPVGRPFVWNFIKEKWPVLVEKFTLNDRYLGLAVKKVCSYFTSDLELQEMKAFFAKYPDAGAGKRKRLQALENVQNNIKWLKTYKQRVKSWLEVEGTAHWYYYRLPSHIKPEHYEILLYPMLEANTFNGTVTITVNVQKPTDCFLVHVVDLNVTRSEVRFALDDSLLMLEDIFPYEENNYLVLKVSDKVPPGRYKLFFQFEGPLTLSLKGLYKSSYVDPDSKERK